MIAWFFKSQPASCKFAAEVNMGSEAFSQHRTAHARRGACFDQRATMNPESAIKFTFGGQLLFDESLRIAFCLDAQFNFIRIIQAGGPPLYAFIFRALTRRRAEPFGKLFSLRPGRTAKSLPLGCRQPQWINGRRHTKMYTAEMAGCQPVPGLVKPRPTTSPATRRWSCVSSARR